MAIKRYFSHFCLFDKRINARCSEPGGIKEFVRGEQYFIPDADFLIVIRSESIHAYLASNSVLTDGNYRHRLTQVDRPVYILSTRGSRDEHTPPLPPFTRESAIEKVRLAEDGWNSRDPAKIALAYSLDTQWRNRAEFATNRAEAQAFLERKWKKELDYRLIKELWAFTDNRIAVRYAYEWHDDSGNWFRSYGNENWEFEPDGLMKRRFACINDMPIKESERLFHWPLGRRPDDHPSLSDLGL